jgi:hypothetical protein
LRIDLSYALVGSAAKQVPRYQRQLEQRSVPQTRDAFFRSAPGAEVFAAAVRRIQLCGQSWNGTFDQSQESLVALPRNQLYLLSNFSHIGRPPRAAFVLCAEHERQLGGGSPLSSLMVAKD